MLKPGSSALTLLLGGLTVMGAMGIDMSLPALPTLTTTFATTPDRAQLTLSLFLLGLATGQLVCGPLSDRFGRRRPLMLCTGLYAVASLICAAAPNIETLIAARLVQGFAASVGPILAAIVRDHYEEARVSQILSRMTMVMALAPLLAPSVGGFLLEWLGWQAIFITLGGIGLFLTAAVALGLDESLRAPDPHATRISRMAANFGTFLSNRRCVGFTLVNTFVVAGILSFVSGAPFVLIEVHRVPPERFGAYFAMTAPALILGSFINSRLVRRVSGERLLRFGLTVLTVAGGALFVLAAGRWDGPLVLMALIMTYLIGQSLVIPNATAAALEPLPQMAGLGAALMGTLQLGGASLAGYVVNALFDGTSQPLSAVIALMGVGAFATYFFFRPWAASSERR